MVPLGRARPASSTLTCHHALTYAHRMMIQAPHRRSRKHRPVSSVIITIRE